MKMKLFPAILSVVVTAALTYLLFSISDGETNGHRVLLCIVSAIGLLLTLSVGMAAKVESSRMAINLRVWGITMSIVVLLVNLLFAWIGINTAFYIVLNTLLIVVHLMIAWNLVNVKSV